MRSLEVSNMTCPKALVKAHLCMIYAGFKSFFDLKTVLSLGVGGVDHRASISLERIHQELQHSVHVGVDPSEQRGVVEVGAGGGKPWSFES